MARPVIGPGNEQRIIALIGDPGFETPLEGGWSFKSIGISPTRVNFRLMGLQDRADGPGRASIDLLELRYAAPDDRRSKSFAIRVRDETGSPTARALIERAVASIIARDKGGFFTEELASPKARDASRRLQLLEPLDWQTAWPGLAICLALVGLWLVLYRFSAHASTQPATPRQPAEETFGYLILWTVLTGPAFCAALGVKWGPLVACVLGAVAVRLAAYRGCLRLVQGEHSRGLWAAGAFLAVCCGVWLRTNVRDDPFCHHAYVRLFVEQGAPMRNPSLPSELAGYHTGFDLLAACVQSWLPMGGDVEWALDVTSILCCLALMGAGAALLQTTRAPAWLLGASMPLIALAGGPVWVSKWLPELKPAWAPWDRMWEGGTLISPLSLFGRRPSTIAFLITALFLRMAFAGELHPSRLRGPSGWLTGTRLALCLGAASQCADELLLLILLVCGWAAVRGGLSSLRAWRRPIACCVALAPLGLYSGGFAAQTLLSLVGAGRVTGSSSGQVGLSLTTPSWPSFWGAEVKLWTLEGLQVALLEFGCVWLSACCLMWMVARRRVEAIGATGLQHLALLLSVGLFATCCLELPSLDYKADLHRFCEAGCWGAIVMGPWAVYQSLHHRWPRSAGVAAFAFSVVASAGALGQLMESVSASVVLYTVALVLWSSFAATPAPGRAHWRLAIRWSPALAASALLSGWMWAPTTHRLPPPSLPPGLLAHLAQAPAPATTLSNALGSNWLLLNGEFPFAPHHRADLNPVTRVAHQRWLAETSCDEFLRHRPTAFILPRPALRRIQRRLGACVSWDLWGRWPSPVSGTAAHRLIGVKSTPEDMTPLLWGRLRYPAAKGRDP